MAKAVFANQPQCVASLRDSGSCNLQMQIWPIDLQCYSYRLGLPFLCWISPNFGFLAFIPPLNVAQSVAGGSRSCSRSHAAQGSPSALFCISEVAGRVQAHWPCQRQRPLGSLVNGRWVLHRTCWGIPSGNDFYRLLLNMTHFLARTLTSNMEVFF